MNVGALLYAPRIDGDDEGWVHYSHRNSDVSYHVEQVPSSTTEEHPSIPLRRKRSLFPARWRKTKLPKAKGEPLLKPYGEEGGDDIDYDRRLLTPSDGSVSEVHIFLISQDFWFFVSFFVLSLCWRLIDSISSSPFAGIKWFY
jgi:hypothetical protein